jgi:hypothetical protein
MLRYWSNRVAFTDKALKVNLERLEDAWEEYQSSRDREGVYRYLTAVFDLVRGGGTTVSRKHTPAVPCASKRVGP